MGKPTGFIEYLRELPLDRPAVERIRDWNEFHLPFDEGKLRAQGANLVDFGAGEPHFPTPRHIKDAAIAAIEAADEKNLRTCDELGHKIST